MLRKIALASGMAASLLYVAVDLLSAVFYPEYHSFTSRMVSELMASGAPTERLVDPLFLAYGVLMMAFGVGVWRSDSRRRVHLLAGLTMIYSALGFLGPTVMEMNVRGDAVTTDDLWHIALTAVLVMLIIAMVVVGAGIRGLAFRWYSYGTLLVIVVFGALSGFVMRDAGGGQPTPWVGLLERINIGAFLLWIGVLAASLLRETRATGGTHLSPA